MTTNPWYGFGGWKRERGGGKRKGERIAQIAEL